MKIKPLFDRIVLKQIEIKEKNSSGLIIADHFSEKPLVGEVVEVGDGKIATDNTQIIVVKKGDYVIFSKYAGNEFKIDNQEFIIIRQSDILAIIEK